MVCPLCGLEIGHRKQESRDNNNTLQPPVIHSGVEAQKPDNIQKIPEGGGILHWISRLKSVLISRQTK